MASVAHRAGLSPDQAPPELNVPSGMTCVEFAAMGTTVSIVLPDDAARIGYAAACLLFARWERALSRFRPESELSALNRSAGRPMPVSALLYDVLVVALDAARATHGLYDPMLQPHPAQLGYDRSFDVLPRHMAPAVGPPLAVGRWRDAVLDPERRCVTLPRGTGVDLGGIAKGLAVDATLAELRGLGIDRALVNAGGDLAVTGTPVGLDAWPVAVATKECFVTVNLSHGALATSSRARRWWRQGEVNRHHLIDPRTGLPAETGMWSVSVVAERCVQAEVAAKVAFILGASKGARFLRETGLTGLLVEQSGHRRRAGSWPDDAPHDHASV